MKHLNLTPALYQYLLDVSVNLPPVLHEMREYTENHPLIRMQISQEQAQFLQFLITILKAESVLEVGTYMGYSALAMALALPTNGKLITCDQNPEYQATATHFWTQAQQQHKIEFRLGPALDTLKKLIVDGFSHTFDFIFIDADKTNYLNYYELALQLISPKGVIAIDNVFWDGKVIDESIQDGQTKTIRQLNEKLKNDPRVNISLLPIADGLFLVHPKARANA